VLGSGIARVRNFEGNRFAFRAESHFLYFIGRHIEEALLVFDGGRTTLYVEPPDPDEALWHGPEPTLEELSEQLQLEVRPVSEFVPAEDTATLPPDDVESALWLEAVLDRPVEAGNLAANELDGELAQAVIELRLRHDAEALAQLRLAVAVTARAHRAGMAATRPQLREAVVRAAIEAEMTANGMIPAYDSIVTVQGEVLHHKTSRRQARAPSSGSPPRARSSRWSRCP
jgi:Xaa-Pro aminopeptidase